VAHVFFPQPLRGLAGDAHDVEAPGATLRELIANLSERFPGMRERLIDPEDDDALMPGMAAVVDGEVTNMGLRTKLEADTEVHFMPAIAGGAPQVTGGCGLTPVSCWAESSPLGEGAGQAREVVVKPVLSTSVKRGSKRR
jgi:molybdopterin synthase sulfur carrier subunit